MISRLLRWILGACGSWRDWNIRRIFEYSVIIIVEKNASFSRHAKKGAQKQKKNRMLKRIYYTCSKIRLTENVCPLTLTFKHNNVFAFRTGEMTSFFE